MSNLPVELIKSPSSDFEPTTAMREIKTRFILRQKKNPRYFETIGLREAEMICPDSRLRKWWQIEGFKEWFLDDEDFEVACELAAYEALEACRDIVANAREKGTARVAAAKLIMTISSKTQKEPESGDENIKKLAGDPSQLRSFLRASIKRTFSKKELLKLVEADSTKD